jgi:hypothetical protein
MSIGLTRYVSAASASTALRRRNLNLTWKHLRRAHEIGYRIAGVLYIDRSTEGEATSEAAEAEGGYREAKLTVGCHLLTLEVV